MRLADNPALAAACASGAPVVPLFILDDETPGDWRWGGASRWGLHHSLEALAERLARAGSRLVLRRGVAADVLREVVAECGADSVLWNRCYEPFAVARDSALRPIWRPPGFRCTASTRPFCSSLGP